MKYRIAMWATAGFMIAVWWAIVGLIVDPIVMISSPIVWALGRLTCPLLLAAFHFHFGVKLYWVLLSNAAIYGLVGLMAENLRRRLRHAV